MIKIRYADLPHGLHAHVRSCGRRSVIYLLPGLSAAQRRDALGRLIRASRQGYGPRLRATGVTFAVARDVAKSTVGNALAAVRCHPAGSTALAALVAAGVVCYAFFVTVTVRFSPRPAGPRRPAAPSGRRHPRGPVPGSGASAPAGTPPAVAGAHGGSPEAAAPARRRAAGTRTGPAPGTRPVPCRCPPAPGRPRGACCRPPRQPAPSRSPRRPYPPRRRRPAPVPRRPATRAGCASRWVPSASVSPGTVSPGTLPAGRREVRVSGVRYRLARAAVRPAECAGDCLSGRRDIGEAL